VFRRSCTLFLFGLEHTLASVAKPLSVSSNSVANWRKRFKEEVLAIPFGKPRSGRPIEINGTARALVTALACPDPPTGSARWTPRLLADTAAELGYCSRISHTYVATTEKSSGPT